MCATAASFSFMSGVHGMRTSAAAIELERSENFGTPFGFMSTRFVNVV